VRWGSGSSGKLRKAVGRKGSVKQDLLEIRAGVKAGRYVNEATVSQGIVQRLLHLLMKLIRALAAEGSKAVPGG
jgi:hypothetical protein